ncbi:MAG: RNA-binding S4 domain-containing protein [Pirellulaceae bacterium]|jgi:ribosome-associated protein
MPDPSDPATPKESITLEQFLKLAQVVSSGGSAKHLIQSGAVLVNGQVETRRKKKLFPGDIVLAEGQELHVASDQDDSGDPANAADDASS